MANIFISYYKTQENDIKTPQHTIEGLANEFSQCGNNVITLNTALFNPYNSNTVTKKGIDRYLLDIFNNFRPDVVFAFNHRIPQSILNSWQGKVIIYDGDHPNFFCETNTILSNLDRYEIFSIVKGWKDDYASLGYDTNKIHYIPMATCVQKEDVPFECNISFLGQRFMYSSPYQALIKKHECYRNIYQMLHEFYTTNTYDYLGLFKKYFPEIWNKDFLGEQDLYPFFDVRCACLSSLAELGLRLSAHNGRWEFLDTTFPAVAASFDPRTVWSLQENADFYNRSRLSLCPMHPQAKGAGFSWRALDVFASNSCLLSSESSELKELIKDYINLPTFKSPSQAFALACDLLENEDRRLSIVSACQQYIEDHARWIHRFRDMERILDVQLINEGEEPGYVKHMYNDAKFSALVKKATPFSAVKASKFSSNKSIVYIIKKTAIKAACLGIFSKKKRKAFRDAALASLEANPNSFFTPEHKLRIQSMRFLSSEKRREFRREKKKEMASRGCSVLHESYAKRLKTLQGLGRPLRVGFFVIFSSVFPAEPLFKKMQEDPCFEPFIAIIPDVSRGVANMRQQMRKSYQDLSAKYEGIVITYDERTNSYIDVSNHMDIFCTANPYDRMTHSNYTMAYLKDKCLSIFFNYTFSTLVYCREVIQTEFMSQVWKVFLETKECLDELKNVQIIHGKNGVVSGYIKMDSLQEAPVVPRERKRIYICPHHTVMGWSKLNISHFLEYHEFFLELAEIFPKIDFVFRPHPLLFVHLRKFSIWNEEEISLYLDRIVHLPNMFFDESSSYLEAFANSDGMIHDCGSFIAEYLYTGNPVCYMLKDKAQLNEIFLPIGKMCIDNHYHAYSKEDILHFIREVIINGNDPIREQRERFVNEKLKINYPNVNNFILGYLKEQFSLTEN